MNTLTATATFVAGLATSLHCAGMCGPLVCAAKAPPTTYHAGRLVSYSLLGALAGWVGEPIVAALHSPPARALTWALAAVLVLVAFGIEKRLPQPRWLALWLIRLRLRHGLGIVTPLIPCGPLWLMLAAAGASGGPGAGAALMATFSAGTVPLFLLLQSGVIRLGPRLSPRILALLQRSMALLAATVLVWRAMLPAGVSCCGH